jgi:hypothetical protein
MTRLTDTAVNEKLNRKEEFCISVPYYAAG